MSLKITAGPVLTPRAKLALGVITAAIAAVLVLLVLNGIGFRFDPFNLAERRADRAEAQATVATDDAAARGLEAAGERASAQRLEIFVERQTAAAAATATLTSKAWSAPDAHRPLDPDRVARLRAHDRELCRIAPNLRGCDTAQAADAGGG